MKRLAATAALTLLAIAAASSAYAADPAAVMSLMEACCEACGIPCPCCPK